MAQGWLNALWMLGGLIIGGGAGFFGARYY